MMKLSRNIIVIATSVLLLTACGDDETSTQSQSAPAKQQTPPSTEAVSTPAKPAASTLSHPVIYQEEIYKNWPYTSSGSDDAPAPAAPETAPPESAVPPPAALSHPVVYQEEIYKNWPYTSSGSDDAPAAPETAPPESSVPPPAVLSHPVVYQEDIYQNWPYTSPPPVTAAIDSTSVEAQVESAVATVEDKVTAAIKEQVETATAAVTERAAAGAAVVAAATKATTGGGKTHTINAEARAFNPDIVYIQPGETVAWINMTSHNSVSIDGLIPEGANPWRSQLGENLKVTLSMEGVYGYVCEPHIGFGMMGVIVVGKPANLDAVKASADKNLQGPYRRILGKLNKVAAS